jgi:HK97 family phage portal protein
MTGLIQTWSKFLMGDPTEKARQTRSNAPYIARDIGYGDSWENYWSSKSSEEIQRLLVRISWIYSAITLISRITASTDFLVKEIKTNEKEIDIPNHEFERLLLSPNPFMTKTFLLQYVVMWLEISRTGAFIYLAPDSTGKITELWPINPNQITIEKSPDQFVKYFVYKPKNSSNKVYKINPNYVAWFRFPDPWDYWGSLPPLWAALLPGEIELGIQSSQKQFYTESRGVPLSIVTLDPELSGPDFETAKADIRSDWEDGTTIAIARAGTIKVESLGFSQKDLEIIGNQELTRDKIDAIFFGYPIRSDSAFDGDGIKEGNRLLKEETIYPLTNLLSEEITKSILNKHFGDDLVGKFKDVRTADRALTIQENSVNSRWKTIDEMRFQEGMPPLDTEQFPDMGSLLVPLANNPSFIQAVYGLTANVDGGNIESPDGVGNLNESQAPEQMTNQLATGDITRTAILTELKRWRTVSKRAFNDTGFALSRPFDTNIIPRDVYLKVVQELQHVATEDGVDSVFKTIREEFDVA